MTVTSPRGRFRARLDARPLLADGGMGTLMYSRGVPQSACLDELPASRPDLVGTAHREYLEAGAELIETLTLGANRHRLAVFGLEDQVGSLNRRAARVAREEGLDERGYRLAFNVGENAGMTIPHLHLHMLGGRRLGPEG